MPILDFGLKLLINRLFQNLETRLPRAYLVLQEPTWRPDDRRLVLFQSLEECRIGILIVNSVPLPGVDWQESFPLCPSVMIW